ncbi:acyl-CoA synthetase (AMP-forming)/AMP-acid ligase II [Streptomyces syringium]|uniref:Acyl-CoA synthetase (AMP-forming)/AMP-acid ligase II n=1 Tax=Streptomyces syringium TaxID=76729 RepID=A0ABS4YCS7_9ACTN|nr:acyl-CoA synthetase (AMP-forming)/AMP-acid ligase II [Streptomyces syringium]
MPTRPSARENTVDGVLRRSARRVPGRTALRYGERVWTYRELDEAVTGAARVLLEHGLRSGDRVAAYGHNSDAYLIGFLGCARAGLVHVPVHHHLTGEDLRYLLEQSGAALVLADPLLEHRLPGGVRALPLRDATGSLLERIEAPPGTFTVLAGGPDEGDLAQLLYTSGTTALPKGAMMTHGALLHAYTSAVLALDLKETDRPLHALPLYHSAQLHVFLMPYLAVGAENTVIDAPDPYRILELVSAGHADSFFAPPTVWIALAGHPGFATRDLSALRKAYYGASVMPAPVLERLRARLPGLAFYNCFGLGAPPGRSPGERSARWPRSSARTSTRGGRRRAGGRCCSWRPGSWTSGAARCPTAPRAKSSTDRRSCARATGRNRRRRQRPSATAGSAPATSRSATARATSPSSTGSRTSSTPAVCSSPPARSRTSSTDTRPSPRRR